MKYSDNPCVGATVVNTTPTRRMDKLSGKSAVGSSVLKENTNEAMANAMKPLVGWTPAQRETAIKRVYLSPANKNECASLDSAIPAKAEASRSAAPDEKTKSEVTLYQARERYRDLSVR